MNSPEQTPAASPEVATATDGPYRTPAEVPSGKGRGWMRRPLIWVFVSGILAAAIMAIALARDSTHVEEFGISRAGPLPEDVEYVTESMSTP